MAAWKIPDVAGVEVGDFGMPLRIDRSDPAAPVEHIGPLCGIGVPMELAQSAGRELHQDTRELLRHRKFRDGRLLGRAAVERFRRLRAERETKRRQLSARERRRRGAEWRLLRFAKCVGGLRCRNEAAHGCRRADQVAPRNLRHWFLPSGHQLRLPRFSRSRRPVSTFGRKKLGFRACRGARRLLEGYFYGIS